MCFFKFGLSVNILTHTEHLCLLIFFREVILSMVVDILSDASLKNALLPSKMAKKCYQNIRKIIRKIVSRFSDFKFDCNLFLKSQGNEF